jgi:hypothetical protein
VRGNGGDEKWIHRLHELERRLKSEREGRLLDRSGARKRLVPALLLVNVLLEEE